MGSHDRAHAVEPSRTTRAVEDVADGRAILAHGGDSGQDGLDIQRLTTSSLQIHGENVSKVPALLAPKSAPPLRRDSQWPIDRRGEDGNQRENVAS